MGKVAQPWSMQGEVYPILLKETITPEIHDKTAVSMGVIKFKPVFIVVFSSIPPDRGESHPSLIIL